MSAMLSDVGYADAVLARQTRGGELVLIDGHMRVEEANPSDKIPVLVLDVTAKEADKLLATLDPISAMAETDTKKLGALLKEIEFSIGDVSSIFQGMEDVDVASDEIVQDEVPERPKKATTKPGDLWCLGNHRLLCGDSTSEKDVKKLMGAVVPFAMVTDQPYGVEYDAKWRNEQGLNNSKQVGKVKNDHRDSWSAAFRMFPGDVAYVWHSGLHTANVERSLETLGFQIRAQIIWLKRRIVISRGHYHWRHEPCLFAVRSTAPSAQWNGGRKQSSVWADVVDEVSLGDEDLYAVRVDDNTIYAFDGMETTVWEIANDKAVGGGHSTQKPVECMARPMRNHGAAGDAVYDPFVGSGTSVVAAEQLKRKCLAMELSPEYCDVVVERWQNFTGKKAKRKSAGKGK